MKQETKRKRPVRTAEIELPAPYEGWRATVWVNMPMCLYDALDKGSFEERLDALVEVVEDWNFIDDQGAPVAITKPAIRESLALVEVVLTLRAIDEAVSGFLASVIKQE